MGTSNPYYLKKEVIVDFDHFSSSVYIDIYLAQDREEFCCTKAQMFREIVFSSVKEDLELNPFIFVINEIVKNYKEIKDFMAYKISIMKLLKNFF